MTLRCSRTARIPWPNRATISAGLLSTARHLSLSCKKNPANGRGLLGSYGRGGKKLVLSCFNCTPTYSCYCRRRPIVQHDASCSRTLIRARKFRATAAIANSLSEVLEAVGPVGHETYGSPGRDWLVERHLAPP